MRRCKVPSVRRFLGDLDRAYVTHCVSQRKASRRVPITGVAPLRLGTTEHARIGSGGRPVMRIAGGIRPLPLLSGPVGPESLRPRHPTLNTPADLKLVDAAFATIVSLRSDAAANAP